MGFPIFIAPVISALMTVLALWLLRPLAQRLNLLDHPRGRKDHAHPTPVTGGLAMALGSTMILGSVRPDASLFAFMVAAVLLVAVGLWDDVNDLRWWWRILAQVVAALVIVQVGGVRIEQLGQLVPLDRLTGVDSHALHWLSIPFTVFATVGIINAVNMVDGVDGLAGSLVLSALLMLGAAAVYSGNSPLAVRTFTLAGAVAGFLAWNMRHPWRRRAEVFMGNAGSAFLGLVIAWASFRLTQNPQHPVTPVLALWFLPVPIMDCLVLIVRRLREGRSPFNGGRDHIHHFMVDAGISPSWVALILSGASLLGGLVMGEAKRAGAPALVLLVMFGCLCLFWYWLSLSRPRVMRFFGALRRLLPDPAGAAEASVPGSDPELAGTSASALSKRSVAHGENQRE